MSFDQGSVIVAGARTPMGRLLGSLKSFSATDLGGIAIKGALTEGEKLTRWYFRPLLLVCAGVMAFAFLIENAGLPAAIIATA